MILYGHPFSSYTWKAQIAFYEKELPFEFRTLDAEYPDHAAELNALWPVAKFPVLEDDGLVFIESSIIIEHLDMLHPEPLMIPYDEIDALDVRTMDRVFDNHVMAPMQAIVAEHVPFLNAVPDPVRIERAKASLSTIYGWLEERLREDRWACGRDFTLADCAGAPALFYADWLHRIPANLVKLTAYRARLLARPSVARCVEDARPYRHYFPLGAPGRD